MGDEMLEILALVTILEGKALFEKIKVPKATIQAFYQIDDGDAHGRKCIVALSKSFTDSKANIYNRAVLYTKADCETLRKRFYAR